MDKKGVYILGASGHAKVVLSLLGACGLRCLGLYDDNEALWGSTFCFGAISELPDDKNISAIIAIGDNTIREKIAEKFTNINWVTLIHPKAIVDKTVQICVGSVVFAGAIIQPYAKIGKHTIINTAATVDHDCVIGDFTHIAPGCHICGAVEIGSKVLMGVGTSVIPCKKITNNVTIGAGATVVKDITEAGTYVGTPTLKIQRERERERE